MDGFVLILAIIVFSVFKNVMQEAKKKQGKSSLPDVFDTIAEAGVRFDRFYVDSPVCVSSRYAMLTGRTLHWDPETETFDNDPGASALLGRAYRQPWHL